jgi:hypothetical protein
MTLCVVTSCRVSAMCEATARVACCVPQMSVIDEVTTGARVPGLRREARWTPTSSNDGFARPAGPVRDGRVGTSGPHRTDAACESVTEGGGRPYPSGSPSERSGVVTTLRASGSTYGGAHQGPAESGSRTRPDTRYASANLGFLSPTAPRPTVGAKWLIHKMPQLRLRSSP